MKKILHKLLFVGLLLSGFAICSQTSLPGTIEVENGNISNSDVAGNRPVVGDGNGGTNNVLLNIRRSSGKNAEIINNVSIATDGNYDFTFTYYKTPTTDAPVKIYSTASDGSSAVELASFGLPRNSNTGATPSSYGTFTVTNVALTTSMNYITIRNTSTPTFDLDNIIVTASAAKPVITLSGSSPVTVSQGSTYTDAGATAVASDGTTDISGSIVVGGDTVDTSTIGTYTITYNVTDGGVAADEVTRTVNVIAPQTTATVDDGNWNDTATWGGNPVPGASDDVFIPDGITVIVSDTQAAKSIKVTNDGTLRITTGGALTVSENIFLGKFDGGLELRNSSSGAALGTLIINGSVQSMNSDDITTSTSDKRIQVRHVLDNDKWYLFANVASKQPYVNRMVTSDFRSNANSKRSIGVYNNANAAGAKYDYFATGTLANSVEVKLAQGMIVSVNGDTGSGETTGDFINRPFYTHNDANNIERAISVNSDSGTADAFNLVGSPYLANAYGNSNANATNVLSQNTGILEEATLWFWNADTQSFVTKNQMSTAFTIPPMVGFFVKSSSGGGNFTFTSAMETHTASGSVSSKNTTERFQMNLNVFKGDEKRSTLIGFVDGKTKGFDNGFDSSIFDGIASGFDVYTQLLESSTTKKLAIQSLPNQNFESQVIPVGVNVSEQTAYTFSLDVSNLPKGYKVFLEDRLTNTFTRLDEASSEYTVTLSEETDGRFFLHVTSSVLSANDEILSSVRLFTTNNNNVRVLGLQNGNATFQLFNILGEQVVNTSFQARNVSNISLPSLTSGVYIVQLTTASGKLNKKIVLK